MVTIKQHTIPAFVKYLRGYKERGAVLKASFLHHTWSPNASQYKGKSTIEGIRRFHRSRGFSDIACHAYACPDGTVFNARPPNINNCACQYPDEGSSTWPAELRRISGGSKRWMNAYGFGIETIGNFDEEDPAQSVAMATSLDVLAAVHRLWAIPVTRCFFHRDVSSKTCPGDRVTKTWVHAELRRRLAVPDEPDVDDWAQEAVDWCRAEGLMVGYPDGLFHGRDPVSRQELAVILHRLGGD